MRLSDLTGGGPFLEHVGGCRSCPRKLIQYQEPDIYDDSFIVVGDTYSDPKVMQRFKYAMRDGGFSEYSYTTLVRCVTPKEGAPTPKEVSCCMAQYTMTEVRGYPYVVLIGAATVKAFFPGVDSGRLYGNFMVHPDYPGQRFYALRHPRWIASHQSEEKRWLKYVKRLCNELRNPRPNVTTIQPGDAEFKEKFQAAMANKWLSFDIETNDRVQSYAVDTRLTSFAIAICEHEVLACHEDDPMFTGLMHQIGEWLEMPDHKVLGWNIGFDLEMQEGLSGVVVRALPIDVMTLVYQYYHVKEPNLKWTVARYLDGYRNLVAWPGREKDPQTLINYNAEDVVYPIQLYRKLFPRLRPRQRDLFLRVASPSSLTLARVSANGVYMRGDLWAVKKDQLTRLSETNLRRWVELDPKFNPELHRSGKGLEKYVFEICNLPILKEGKQGPNLDERVVTELMEDHDAHQLEHLLVDRSIEKQRTTYIDPLPGLVQHDGRVHPSYFNTATSSGRLSSRRPNYQNQPRDGEIAGESWSVRELWGASVGHDFMRGDFSQMELRIAVCLAKSAPAIQKFREGVDLHTQTAQIISNKTNPSKEDRQSAKTVNFALIYGGSAEGLVEQAWHDYGVRMSLHEAKRFKSLFFKEVVPGLEAWHYAEEAKMKACKGEVEQITGHVWFYEDWNSKDSGRRAHAARSCINATCQGPAGYIGIQAMSLTEQLFRESDVSAKVIGQVHDDIQIESLHEDTDRAMDLFLSSIPIIKSWIAEWFVVPLVMEAEVGTSWSDTKFVRTISV